ncbi:hypothetical protein I5Q34_33025 [Streptomyces sp. AV19]|uniref:COG1470 family protein n=1 Tax=Streptomyces sp. AV19 TaxID=2793068 RepID=UPI0018FEBBFE|nr:hypothetical protein [Streptomyces sp. AV19]MBH1939027.1 hypothetical protein [Streptomyces sp. AV19]MDG4536932.1 hypothetical protein [Streptomyces sp. AV19]
MSLRAELIAPAEPVIPGEQAEAELLVCNDGHLVDAYEVSLIGKAAQWSGEDLGRVAVYPGRYERLRIPIAPPRDSRTAPGPVVFAVKAQSLENRDIASVPEAVLQVGSFHELEAQFTRKKVKGRFPGSTLLRVRNLGNDSVRIWIKDDTDDESTATVHIRRSGFALRPEERGRVAVRAKGRKPLFAGKPIIHRIPLTVEDGGGAQVSLQFEYEQVPFLTKRLIKLTTALVAVVMAGALAWVSPIGAKATPKVKAVAGKTQLEQVQAEATAQEQAKKKQKTAEKKKEADAQKAKAPKPQDFQKSLTTTGGSTAKESEYKVPKGYVLQLTQITLTTVGNVGDVATVVAGPETLGVYSMAASEPREIQSKAPIKVDGGRKVSLSVVRAPKASPVPGRGPQTSAQTSACQATVLMVGKLVPKKGPFAEKHSPAAQTT